ncbi:MAG: glycosyltransferase family 4 protein [Rikenellaceae bacterium]
MKRLFIVVNIDRFFLSHRKAIALRAQREGFQVTIVTKDSGMFAQIEQLGLQVINMPMNKSGRDLIEEIQTCNFLYKLYSLHRPDIVHHVGLKSILWGSIAAKRAGVKGVVNAVSGLGVLFAGEGLSITARVILLSLRYALNRKNVAVIFQNHEDRDLFERHRIVTPQSIFMTRGSGVDLDEYCYTPEPVSDKVRVLFAARMVVDKGLFVLTDAAHMLKDSYGDRVEFILCGALDDNPNAAQKSDLDRVTDGAYIKWIGHSSNVLAELQACHIFAFPSYYKEGLPKSLIEANAVGRPIVTTDSIGCRDAVVDGYNGYVIPIKRSDLLSERLAALIDNRELRIRMGLRAREFAELHFSIEDVVAEHIKIYNLLMLNKL